MCVTVTAACLCDSPVAIRSSVASSTCSDQALAVPEAMDRISSMPRKTWLTCVCAAASCLQPDCKHCATAMAAAAQPPLAGAPMLDRPRTWSCCFVLQGCQRLPCTIAMQQQLSCSRA